MKKLILQVFFLLMLFSAGVKAQQNEYSEAERMAVQANEKLLSGEVTAADALIRKSIETYPVYTVFEYLKTMAKLPDIAGCNIIIKKLTDRVKTMSEVLILAPDPMVLMMDNKSIIPIKREKNRVWFSYLLWSYELNRTYSSRPYILNSLKAMQEPVIVEKKDKTGYDYEYNMQVAYKLTSAMYAEDYELANQIIDAIPVSAISPKEVLMTYRMSVLLGQGEYVKGIEMTEQLHKSKAYEAAADAWMFNFYSAMGDEQALKYYEKMDSRLKENNRMYYALALVDIGKKDYNAALKKLDKSASLRNDKLLMADMLVEWWEFYRAYGDVYTGLKAYSKARDNYNLALLYYPGYKKATDALANMENLAAEELTFDKTGPVLVLTEPAVSRGIKVVPAGATVMVKGTATDPSGVKEVLVNGIKMFVQPSGEFWGDVPMKVGLNKLHVLAFDLADNKSEQFFDVQASVAPAKPEDIIVVESKTGKNYCLLIASQNYADTSIPSLENPIADAVKLKIVIKQNYGFEDKNIISLFNPTGTDIKRQLLELAVTIHPEDNLLIFYAGHGIWVEKEKKGYWLMTDAVYGDVNTWIPNKVVLDLIAKLPARHTLLITDACFSGSVFKTRGIPGHESSAIKELDSKITRVAITSGNDTEVPDESVFMKHLVKALSENKEPYLTAQKMFITQILEAVMTETKTEPRYGTLELAGHVGGDFIFTKK